MKFLKLLRKLLLIIPVLAIGTTVLFAFISFCLGFGKGIWYGNSEVHILSNAYFAEFSWQGVTEMCIGNTFNILGMLLTAAVLVLVILNISEKYAKGPTLLVAAIATFILQLFFLPRPIMLIYYTTQDVGDVFEGFNWATFSVSTLMWIPCLVLFILNKTLFKKVLNGEQPAPAPAKEEKAEAPKAAEGTWFCPNCGAKNNGAFCSSCGTKKPE